MCAECDIGMGGACGAYGGEKRRIKHFWLGKLRERHHLGDLDVNGRIILRWICRKRDVGYGLDRAG